ncbi:MAG: 30S ribosomal protein S3, small subunit ribosomal protein S3 [Candidatus Gottesmanbacteria bacterium GW2011_GWA2_43_14]|uniref:Small ribosomal subunit protein uS3 n=1 Tax=Candidatus Gottesmanbacteria bacterium GW2011_GWA2_43_14 TaxID=1618443 RepID=A0A0G1DEH2_9BACT|nr:MAG: 30S ribosomal protein S3, small subunit ribosomal protein S3 [Candidatus Gottesmanbacteria bacterium GW2011_GWA2_43_14]
MGKKVNPMVFRLGVINTWDSRWFADNKQYKYFILEDSFLRDLFFKRIKGAGLTKVEIERSINTISITMHVVRPGLVIGRGGQGMEELKKFVQKSILNFRTKYKKTLDKKDALKIDLKVEPVKEPNLNAHFMATQISEQLQKRLPHKRVVNFALEKMMNSGARGAKILLAGRIAGAEIARRETYKKGTIPLSTIRENIDYASVPSLTKSGYIGIKVWICR